MDLTKDSSSVEFYREAVNVLIVQMGVERDEDKIDQLHGQVLRLTSRMADAAFTDIVRRTAMLALLVEDLKRITAGAKAGNGAGKWIDQLAGIIKLATP